MISLIHKVEKEGNSLMVKIYNLFIKSMLTSRGLVNPYKLKLYNKNNKNKDYGNN
jgi:hypothetical protein